MTSHIMQKTKLEWQTVVTILLAFIIVHAFTFIETFSSAYYFKLLLKFFHFMLQYSLEHYLQGKSSHRNSLNSCLSGDILISPSLWKDNFAGYRIYGWKLFLMCVSMFPFSTLNVSTHCLWLLKFWMRNLSNLFEEYLHVTSCCSFAAFKILYFSLDFKSLITVCLTVCEFILLGVCSISWMFIIIYFIKFGKFWPIISCNIVPASFSSTGHTRLLFVCLVVCHCC